MCVVSESMPVAMVTDFEDVRTTFMGRAHQSHVQPWSIDDEILKDVLARLLVRE